MNRRRFLGGVAVAGTTALTGCTGGLGGLSGPKYQDTTEKKLMIGPDAFPSGWKRNDKLNKHFQAVFTDRDTSLVVLLDVKLKDSTKQAKNSFMSSKQGFGDPHTYDIGDAGFWATQNEFAYTIYRDSNALGEAAAVQQSGTQTEPDQARSQKYAKKLYSHWQDV